MDYSHTSLAEYATAFSMIAKRNRLDNVKHLIDGAFYNCPDSRRAPWKTWVAVARLEGKRSGHTLRYHTEGSEHGLSPIVVSLDPDASAARVQLACTDVLEEYTVVRRLDEILLQERLFSQAALRDVLAEVKRISLQRS